MRAFALRPRPRPLDSAAEAPTRCGPSPRLLAELLQATAGLAEAAGAEPPPSELAKATGAIAEAFSAALAGLSAEDTEKLAPIYAHFKEHVGPIAPTTAAAAAVAEDPMETAPPTATVQQQAPPEPARSTQSADAEPSATAPPMAQSRPGDAGDAAATQSTEAGSTSLPAASPTPASAATEERARVVSEECQSDSHYVKAQKRALRGRLCVRPHGEEELQTAIAAVLQTRQQQDEDEARAAALSLGPSPEVPVANCHQPSQAAAGDDPSSTFTAPPEKRGRHFDSEGRDAGDDSGMASTTQENSGAPP